MAVLAVRFLKMAVWRGLWYGTGTLAVRTGTLAVQVGGFGGWRRRFWRFKSIWFITYFGYGGVGGGLRYGTAIFAVRRTCLLLTIHSAGDSSRHV